MNDSPRMTRREKAYFWLVLPTLVFSFYLVDHDWGAAHRVQMAEEDYDGVSFTASNLESVSSRSLAGRVTVAFVGLLGLMMPSARLRWRSPLFWALASYFGWLLCTLIWSVDAHQTFYKLGVLGVFSLAALGISRAFNARTLMLLFATTCLMFIGLGVLAEVIQGTLHLGSSSFRFSGTSHPNTEAIYGAILCLAMLLLPLRHQRSTQLLVQAILFGLGITTLYLTKSRTALAAFLVALGATQALRLRGMQRWMLAWGGLTVATLGILGMSLLGSDLQEKMGGVAALGRGEDLSSLTGRIPLWQELLHDSAKHSTLGYGYLAYWNVDRVETMSELLGWDIPHGHNMYLDLLLDTGLIGLSLFVLMLLVAWGTAALRYTRTNDVGLAFTFGLITFAIGHGFAESLFRLPTFPTFVLMCVIFRMLWQAKPNLSEPMEATAQIEVQNPVELVEV